MSKHDVIIVGAGLSGLAAGIRFSQYGHDVVIFERHRVSGGLNSYYLRNGNEVDTGLHALTNISRSGLRSAPLNVLLRQLRLRREDLDLREHTRSSVCFPQKRLVFDNHPQRLLDGVAEEFPEEADAFREFHRFMCEFDPFFKDGSFRSSASVLRDRLSTPLLRDMISCPVMFYGNSRAGDMDFRQFCIIYRSIFVEGIGRPSGGMKRILELLEGRFAENGGQLRLGCGIRSLVHDGQRVTGVIDDRGEHHEAKAYLSCAGGPETGRLLSSPLAGLSDLPAGEMSYVEMLFELEGEPSDCGLEDGIAFHSTRDGFEYRCPVSGVSDRGYIVCVPANFQGIVSREVRVSALTSHVWWESLEASAYGEMKRGCMERARRWMEKTYPGIRLVPKDMYTPKTFSRFTGRLNGAIYGMPEKNWSGRTCLENLGLCGADQGYLGIVGALMSGVTMANVRLREV